MTMRRSFLSLSTSLSFTALVVAACTTNDPSPSAPGPSAEGGASPDGASSSGTDPVPALTRTIAFRGISHPISEAEKRVVNAASSVVVDGKEVPIGYKTIMRGGDRIGANVFGALTNKDGETIKANDGSPMIDLTADFSSLLPIDGKLFMVTHFESSKPAAMYVTELAQNKQTGELTPVATQPIDFSASGGLWTPCAGSVSPWNTHLGSEEYEPDARAFGAAATVAAVDANFRQMARYFKVDPETATLEDLRSVLDPYHYGFAVEVTVHSNGSAAAVKHYAMGRRALELPYVMPDKKTVYLTDDGDNTGFYMFLASTPGDLTKGKLYAMKWNQTSADGPGAADAAFIQLGPEASDANIEALLVAKTKFTDIFATETPNTDGTCPTAGFHAIHQSRTNECLKLKVGQELAASRLETRRYAAYLGATTEMNKEEGFTFDPDSMTAYVAITDIGAGMVDNAPDDLGGPNHVRLKANLCGAVYSLAVGGDATIGSDYVVKSWKGLIAGEPMTWPPGTCAVDKIANPDNISFVTKYKTLIIGEDCGKAQHQNDAVWSMDIGTKAITRILTTPFGAESTSVYFYPNVGGFAYVNAVVQHPFGESDVDKLSLEPDPAKAKMPYVGYLGPFPKMD
jgi:uncharacterized protein